MSRKAQLIAAIEANTAARVKAEQRVAQLLTKEAELILQVQQLDAIEALDVGSQVLVKVGRGETRAEVVGTIRAVKPGESRTEEDGSVITSDRLFKVEVSRSGDEFDAEFVVVPESQVSVVTAEAFLAEDPVDQAE